MIDDKTDVMRAAEIKNIRKTKRMSQKALSDNSGIALIVIQMMERGEMLCSNEIYNKIKAVKW